MLQSSTGLELSCAKFILSASEVSAEQADIQVGASGWGLDRLPPKSEESFRLNELQAFGLDPFLSLGHR